MTLDIHEWSLTTKKAELFLNCKEGRALSADIDDDRYGNARYKFLYGYTSPTPQYHESTVLASTSARSGFILYLFLYD